MTTKADSGYPSGRLAGGSFTRAEQEEYVRETKQGLDRFVDHADFRSAAHQARRLANALELHAEALNSPR